MPEYDRAFAEATSKPMSFMTSSLDQLQDIKQIVYGLQETLNEKGFYPNPEVARSNDPKPPEENNFRAEMERVIRQIHDTALQVRQQLDRLI
jgi:hypothetical protein